MLDLAQIIQLTRLKGALFSLKQRLYVFDHFVFLLLEPLLDLFEKLLELSHLKVSLGFDDIQLFLNSRVLLVQSLLGFLALLKLGLKLLQFCLRSFFDRYHLVTVFAAFCLVII